MPYPEAGGPATAGGVADVTPEGLSSSSSSDTPAWRPIKPPVAPLPYSAGLATPSRRRHRRSSRAWPR